jgi:hypothetical protein
MKEKLAQIENQKVLVRNKDRIEIIRDAKASGYTGSYIELFQNKRDEDNKHIEANTNREIRQGLEGAPYGTSATLNFDEIKPHTLEGRQSYPVEVIADGLYQGILTPGEENFMVDTSSEVEEIPMIKYGGIAIKQGTTETGITEDPYTKRIAEFKRDGGFVNKYQGDKGSGVVSKSPPPYQFTWEEPEPPEPDYFNIFKTATLENEELRLSGYTPTSLSGATIGQGFDVGQFSTTQLNNMFGDNPELLKKLKPYAGLSTKTSITDKGLKAKNLKITSKESEYINQVLFSRNFKALGPYLQGEGATEGNMGVLFGLRHWAGRLGPGTNKLSPKGTNYIWNAIQDKEYTTQDLLDAIRSTKADLGIKKSKTAQYNTLERFEEKLKKLVEKETPQKVIYSKDYRE